MARWADSAPCTRLDPTMPPTSFDIGFSLNPCPRKLGAPQRQQPGGSSHFQPFKNPTMNRPPACTYLLYVLLDQYYLVMSVAFTR